MSIRSFSGTHDWHPSVLIDTDADEYTADTIIENIESGRCPRCERPLPQLPEYPFAGSRVTACRSIPICGPCGTDEAYELIMEGYLSSAADWPLDAEDIDDRRDRIEGRSQVGILTADHLITEDGVSQVVNPRNTGGWAQYGQPVGSA